MGATVEERGDTISATISGNVSGQVAVGKNIAQSHIVAPALPPTEEEIADLRLAFAGARAQVAAVVPEERKAAAIERLDELEEAVIAEQPDLGTMDYVKRWFVKHLPSLAGAVTSLVVHPVVGKVVAAAGDAVLSEYEQRFG